MATLVLEDLNLVTLNQLLHRLDGKITIEQLREAVGTRELFTEPQAQNIEAFFSKVISVAVREPFDPAAKAVEFQGLLEKYAGDWYGDFDIDLGPFFPENVSGHLTLLVKRWEFGPKEVVACNPSVGSAFWPKLADVIQAIGNAGDALDRLEQQVISTLKARASTIHTNILREIIETIPLDRDTDALDHFIYRFSYDGALAGLTLRILVFNKECKYHLVKSDEPLNQQNKKRINHLSASEFAKLRKALTDWSITQIEKAN